MLAESIRFDDSSRPSHSDQPVPPGGVLYALRQAAERSGIDPVAELYNESLRAASEGHLRMARERLQVLLGMSPDDGEARLLLAKVHVAGQKWQDALAALDEAQACGQHIPLDLRHAVEEHLQADLEAEEQRAAQVRAREQGEVRSLRQEARKLRSENAQLLDRAITSEGETRRWAWTTAGVSGLALLFLLANLFFGGRTEAPEPVVEQVAAPEVPEAPSAEPATGDTASEASTGTRSVTDRANELLASAPELGDARLDVTVGNGIAVLEGSVRDQRQLRQARDLLSEMPDVERVDMDQVANLARTQGTRHTVVQGDNLSRIAFQYYGESHLASEILEANHATLGGSANLSIGQELVIPAID